MVRVFGGDSDREDVEHRQQTQLRRHELALLSFVDRSLGPGYSDPHVEVLELMGLSAAGLVNGKDGLLLND